MLPMARQETLVVREIAGELVVYDREQHRAHRLNRAATLVWRHCDGRTSVAELAALLEQELDIPADEAVVWLALDRLEKAHLLRDALARHAVLTRRQVVRDLGLAGAAGLLLPIVTSIAAPTPAIAQYMAGRGRCCCYTQTGAIFANRSTCPCPTREGDPLTKVCSDTVSNSNGCMTYCASLLVPEVLGLPGVPGVL